MNPDELFALLPDMAVFARVVDAGNFSVAARQLGSTPSTVSRQIKRLEEALNAQGAGHRIGRAGGALLPGDGGRRRGGG